MDWITGIQQAINYIEDNLLNELDLEEIAKRAYVSPFHFQRIFHILSGFTLGEYIRSRRLSLAAADLQANGGKIIDIAVKYGYNTSESFSRAFERFHGVLPSAAKHAVLKSFSRLSIKVLLEGGNVMDYRIEDKKNRLVGRNKFEYFAGNLMAVEIIDENLDQSEMDVNYIASELSMSRSKLYMKIKSMTDKSIVEFITSYRLRKAARLIIEENISIREVMDKIGIESQSYFTRVFKKEFGDTPTAFAAKNKKKK